MRELDDPGWKDACRKRQRNYQAHLKGLYRPRNRTYWSQYITGDSQPPHAYWGGTCWNYHQKPRCSYAADASRVALLQES